MTGTPITSDDFEAWLASRPGDESVGCALDAARCPSAVFINLRYGSDADASVAPDAMLYTTPDGVRHDVATPLWLTRFVETLDDAYGDDAISDKSVSAETALLALRESRKTPRKSSETGLNADP